MTSRNGPRITVDLLTIERLELAINVATKANVPNLSALIRLALDQYCSSVSPLDKPDCDCPLCSDS